MNPFLFNLANKIASKRTGSKRYSNHKIINKGVRILIVNSSYYLTSIVYITLGIISYAFGVKSFLLPNELIDGGGTGISLLMSIKTQLPLHYCLYDHGNYQ